MIRKLLLSTALLISLARLDAADSSPTQTTAIKPSPAQPATSQSSTASSTAPAKTMKDVLLENYVKIWQALAADDLTAAKKAAAELSKSLTAPSFKVIGDKVDPVANAANIQASREAFKGLSLLVEPVVAGDKNYTVMYCPMQKADWVQNSKEVKNPYYGKAMLTCGGPK